MEISGRLLNGTDQDGAKSRRYQIEGLAANFSASDVIGQGNGGILLKIL